MTARGGVTGFVLRIEGEAGVQIGVGSRRERPRRRHVPARAVDLTVLGVVDDHEREHLGVVAVTRIRDRHGDGVDAAGRVGVTRHDRSRCGRRRVRDRAVGGGPGAAGRRRPVAPVDRRVVVVGTAVLVVEQGGDLDPVGESERQQGPVDRADDRVAPADLEVAGVGGHVAERVGGDDLDRVRARPRGDGVDVVDRLTVDRDVARLQARVGTPDVDQGAGCVHTAVGRGVDDDRRFARGVDAHDPGRGRTLLVLDRPGVHAVAGDDEGAVDRRERAPAVDPVEHRGGRPHGDGHVVGVPAGSGVEIRFVDLDGERGRDDRRQRRLLVLGVVRRLVRRDAHVAVDVLGLDDELGSVDVRPQVDRARPHVTDRPQVEADPVDRSTDAGVGSHQQVNAIDTSLVEGAQGHRQDPVLEHRVDVADLRTLEVGHVPVGVEHDGVDVVVESLHALFRAVLPRGRHELLAPSGRGRDRVDGERTGGEVDVAEVRFRLLRLGVEHRCRHDGVRELDVGRGHADDHRTVGDGGERGRVGVVDDADVGAGGRLDRPARRDQRLVAVVTGVGVVVATIGGAQDVIGVDRRRHGRRAVGVGDRVVVGGRGQRRRCQTDLVERQAVEGRLHERLLVVDAHRAESGDVGVLGEHQRLADRRRFDAGTRHGIDDVAREQRHQCLGVRDGLGVAVPEARVGDVDAAES